MHRRLGEQSKGRDDVSVKDSKGEKLKKILVKIFLDFINMILITNICW